MKLRMVLAIVAAAGFLAEAASRPNILWITIEDTSPNEFSCYGNTDIETPELDALAKRGVLFTRATATAPHCSPARSTLITGCYATTYGMDVHREQYETPGGIFYPAFLREAGYFCTNQDKTDYNTKLDHKAMWDECGREATYNSPARKPGQPFFAIFNTAATHMGRIRSITLDGRRDFKALGIDPATLTLPPHVPDLPAVRSDLAYQLEASRESSQWLGAFLDDLEARGLSEDTIVFFYSDHGGCLPRGKGYPFESGLRIPLVVYVPPKWQAEMGVEPGSRDDRGIGFVDFAPTLLSMAGIEPPDYMQGDAFLGTYADVEDDAYQFGFRTNQENYHFDPCRTAARGNLKYIRNYVPHKPFFLRNLYQWGMPANLAWDELVFSGSCTNEAWLQPYQPKPAEMLFDVNADPWELNNLAGDPAYAKDLARFRTAVSEHVRESKDLGFVARGLRDKPGGLYAWLRETDFPLDELVAAAELASMPNADDMDRLIALLKNPHEEIRFWGAIGFCTLAARGDLDQVPAELLEAAESPTREIAAAAAAALCHAGPDDVGLPNLMELFEQNFNLAYSSLETLTWYPERKELLRPYVPKLVVWSKPKGEIDRMSLTPKARSLLVNLGELAPAELYTEAEREKEMSRNLNPRQFKYPELFEKEKQ